MKKLPEGPATIVVLAVAMMVGEFILKMTWWESLIIVAIGYFGSALIHGTYFKKRG